MSQLAARRMLLSILLALVAVLLGPRQFPRANQTHHIALSGYCVDVELGTDPPTGVVVCTP